MFPEPANPGLIPLHGSHRKLKRFQVAREGKAEGRRRKAEVKNLTARCWSARTGPRFGTGRHVSQSESGDMSPHSKRRRGRLRYGS